jgi:hypothetical protein
MLFDVDKKISQLSADEAKQVHTAFRYCMNSSNFSSFMLEFGHLKENVTWHFVSKGNWSLHELIEFILVQNGKADVTFCTWAIRQEPVRALLAMKEGGLIGKINCILDYRASQRDIETTLLVEGNFDKVVYKRSHAKVVVIESEKYKVAIIGSQNFTKNPRIECGILTTDVDAVDFHLNWMKHEIET